MYDLVIENARLCDGTGAPSYMGTLGVHPNRGVLAAGKVADLVLFDPDRVTSKQPEFADDFPLGGRRLIAKAEGIEATFLAGTQLYNHGEHTGELPGRILRSYE